jgi:uncharacterized membrane protein YhhN
MMLFPGGIEGTSNATLILSVAAAVMYGIIVNTRPTLARSAVKTLAVGLLAVLVVVENGPLLLFTALALSAAGDAFLSREGDRAFLAGLACFLAAHLVYIALFMIAGGGAGPVLAETWRIGVAVVIGISALVMVGLLLRRVKPAMRLPILAYVAGIVAMGLAALSTGSPFMIGGAILFMASDSLLAAERFLVSAISPWRSTMRVFVWALYYAAQLLITLGFILA